jgi:hypothetical protein
MLDSTQVGDDSFKYIKERTGFDLKEWLINIKNNGKHKIER